MHPSARIKVTNTMRNVARLRVFNYGEDERVANEGDLLIVSDTGITGDGRNSDTMFEITIRGKDMQMFMDHVAKAMNLYEANKDYLSQPATRQLSAVAQLPDRMAANLDAVWRYAVSQ